jgi:RNA polymerase sigma-70 factor (ECF subfamily)
VLHDTFAVPFDEIAAILDRTPEATRQLASRARRRVRAAESIPEVETEAQRAAVDAFLDASRNGDFAKLVAVLHPDVVLRVDLGAAAGAPQVIRGAEAVAARAQLHSRRDLVIQRALIDGAFGMIATRNGQRHAAGRFTVKDGRIVEFEILADPERLGQLDVSIMDR